MKCANFQFDLGRVCKHEFCWLCAAPYAGAVGIRNVGNHAHESTCPYHRVYSPALPVVRRLVEAQATPRAAGDIHHRALDQLEAARQDAGFAQRQAFHRIEDEARARALAQRQAPHAARVE